VYRSLEENSQHRSVAVVNVVDDILFPVFPHLFDHRASPLFTITLFALAPYASVRNDSSFVVAPCRKILFVAVLSFVVFFFVFDSEVGGFVVRRSVEVRYVVIVIVVRVNVVWRSSGVSLAVNVFVSWDFVLLPFQAPTFVVIFFVVFPFVAQVPVGRSSVGM
jgi:hypothetical protein